MKQNSNTKPFVTHAAILISLLALRYHFFTFIYYYFFRPTSFSSFISAICHIMMLHQKHCICRFTPRSQLQFIVPTGNEWRALRIEMRQNILWRFLFFCAFSVFMPSNFILFGMECSFRLNALFFVSFFLSLTCNFFLCMERK